MLPPNQSAHFSHKAPRPQALARHREWLPDFGPQRLMFASLYLSIRKFIRPTQRVNRWRGPPQTGEMGFRRPCSLSTILENMTEDEQQELLRTVAQTHASLSEGALKLRLELPPKAPALKTALKAEGGPFISSAHCGNSLWGILNKQTGGSGYPRCAGAGRWSTWNCDCGNLLGGHTRLKFVSGLGSHFPFRFPLRGSKVQPSIGTDVILWHAMAKRVHVAEVQLGQNLTLLGGFAKPLCRFKVVLRHDLATDVHLDEVQLGLGKTQRGTPAKPLHGPGFALPGIKSGPYSTSEQSGGSVAIWCAVKGAIPQRVRTPPGNCRSSR